MSPEDIRIALDGILAACETVKKQTDSRIDALERRVKELEEADPELPRIMDDCASFIPSPSKSGSEI